MHTKATIREITQMGCSVTKCLVYCLLYFIHVAEISASSLLHFFLALPARLCH